jgi:outer membrane receptor for monomeric catechols
LWGIALLAIALIVGFYFANQAWRPVLVFGAAVIAGAAGLTTAINNVDQRAAANAKAEEQAKAAKVAAAFDWFHRWNDPRFFYCKKSSREVTDHFKTVTVVEEQVAYLKADLARYANLIDMLNTFEGLAVAVEEGVVDETTARRFFRGIVVEYWHQMEGLIKKNRAEANNPRLWKEFETLYRRWRD